MHYRNYADLADCLESLDTHHPDVPVIVIDHAAVPARADAIARRFPRVLIEATPENPGFAAGANRGLRAAPTPYVLLLNPDCLLRHPIAGALCDFADRHPDAAVVGPRVLNEDGSVQPSARRFPNATTALAGRRSWLTAAVPGNWLSRYNLLTIGNGVDPRDVDWVSGACMLLRRQALDAIGGFDEGYFLYWEDADLCRRLKSNGWRTVYYPGVSVSHLGARSSRFNARDALIAFHKSAFRYYLRHAGPVGRGLSPFAALLLAGRLAAALTYQTVRAWTPDAAADHDRDAIPSGTARIK